MGKFKINTNEKTGKYGLLYIRIDLETEREIERIAKKNGIGKINLTRQMIYHCLKELKSSEAQNA